MGRSTREVPVSYFGVGSLTPSVMEALIGRTPIFIPAFLSGHEIRLLRPEQMSPKERETMGGQSRFILLAKKNLSVSVKGWLFTLQAAEAPIAKAFDISDPQAYLQTFSYVRTDRNTTGASAIVRKWTGNTIVGEARDPHSYAPYEPFSENPATGEVMAIAVARSIRETALRG